MTNQIMTLADAYATQMIHAHYHPMKEARAALLAEVDRVSKDAERYRWLLNSCGFSERLNGATELNCFFYKDRPCDIGDLDAAIDAAMKGKS